MGRVLKSICLTAMTMILGMAMAMAGPSNPGKTRPKGSIQHMPPTGYTSQWWVHPSGCEYSRAGRPGEIVWYVIINSIGRKKCPRLIVQQANDGAYDGLSNLN